MTRIDEILERQDGVIGRRQALACGLTPTAVAKLVRRRDWAPVHDGVYVNHTGPLTWRQRAWAAVLVCWPAALGGRSARRAHEGPGRRDLDDDGAIEVVIAHRRRSKPPDGVRVTRLRRFEQTVQWNLSPPRLHYDDAILQLADDAPSDLAAIAVLADACGGRRTSADRLRARLEETMWMHRRAWLRSVLDDVAEGTCSVLEHGYLTLVERPHGLPRGLRQLPAVDREGRSMYRDVHYGGERPRWRQNVELDGRLFHSSARQRDRDMDRDLDAAVQLEDTVRLGYGQVFDRGCATAARVALLLTRRGWGGRAHACPNCPPTAEWGIPDQAS